MSVPAHLHALKDIRYTSRKSAQVLRIMIHILNRIKLSFYFLMFDYCIACVCNARLTLRRHNTEFSSSSKHLLFLLVTKPFPLFLEDSTLIVLCEHHPSSTLTAMVWVGIMH